MFFNELELCRKGQLGKYWLAAHWTKRLSKKQIATADVREACETIMGTKPRKYALRTSGHLLLGVVRIHHSKQRSLANDCAEAFTRIQLVFHRGAVDLPEGGAQATYNAITLQEEVPDLDDEFLDLSDGFGLVLDVSSASFIAHHKDDITLQSHFVINMSQEENNMDNDTFLNTLAPLETEVARSEEKDDPLLGPDFDQSVEVARGDTTMDVSFAQNTTADLTLNAKGNGVDNNPNDISLGPFNEQELGAQFGDEDPFAGENERLDASGLNLLNLDNGAARDGDSDGKGHLQPEQSEAEKSGGEEEEFVPLKLQTLEDSMEKTKKKVRKRPKRLTVDQPTAIDDKSFQLSLATFSQMAQSGVSQQLVYHAVPVQHYGEKQNLLIFDSAEAQLTSRLPIFANHPTLSDLLPKKIKWVKRHSAAAADEEDGDAADESIVGRKSFPFRKSAPGDGGDENPTKKAKKGGVVEDIEDDEEEEEGAEDEGKRAGLQKGKKAAEQNSDDEADDAAGLNPTKKARLSTGAVDGVDINQDQTFYANDFGPAEPMDDISFNQTFALDTTMPEGDTGADTKSTPPCVTILREEIEEQGSVSFLNLLQTKRASRMQAAQMFHELLVLKTHGSVGLAQRNPYEEITVSKTKGTAPLTSLPADPNEPSEL